MALDRQTGCCYVNVESQRQPTHTGTAVLVSGYKDHTDRSGKKKKFNSPIHLRVKRMLGKVERGMGRVIVFVHSALSCNNLQLDVITHGSRAVQIN